MSRVRFLTCVFDVILIRPGYTSIIAQLLSVPPYAAAALLTVAVGFIADRTRQRGITNMLISLIGIVGFALMMGAKSAGAKYAGTFLGAMGIYPTISNTISWCTNNTEGETCLLLLSYLSYTEGLTGVYKRGVSLGFVIGWGNLNGIVSSNIYRDKDSPMYYPGHGVVLAYLVLFLFGGSMTQYILLRSENRKRQRGERDSWVQGLNSQQIEERGDMRPDFRYML